MNKRQENGFTLIEVLLSITILTIVLMTFFQFFSQSMLFSSHNEEKQQAINTVRQLMNELQENKESYETLKTKNSSITDSSTLSTLFPKTRVNNIDELQNQFTISILPEMKTNLVQVRITATSKNRQNVSAETYGFISPK